MKIILETSSKNKKEIVSEVLQDLPEWFGLPEAIEEYVIKCQEYPLWVAKDNHKIIGFISLKETSRFTAEIYCMGVKREFHRQSIGNQLFKEFSMHCEEKYQFMQVKTVAEGHYTEYDQTIKFYKSLGFVEFECFPTLWDEWNPCQILVKAIN